MGGRMPDRLREDEESRLERFLRAAYDIAIDGAPAMGIASAYDLAEQLAASPDQDRAQS